MSVANDSVLPHATNLAIASSSPEPPVVSGPSGDDGSIHRLVIAVTGQSQLSVLIGVTIVNARTGNRLFHFAAVLFLLCASVATIRTTAAVAQPIPPQIEEWGDPDHPSSSADQKGTAPSGGDEQKDPNTQTSRHRVQLCATTSTTAIPSWFVVRSVIVSFVRTVSPSLAMSMRL